jgi:hypothetical protein
MIVYVGDFSLKLVQPFKILRVFDSALGEH